MRGTSAFFYFLFGKNDKEVELPVWSVLTMVLWVGCGCRIAGLQTDTHLVGNQFNIALAGQSYSHFLCTLSVITLITRATVFYVPYILVELPSNWVLKRMQANRWLPLLICTWGTVTTLSGLVQNFGGLTAVRMVLGMCEGGLLPGMVRY